MSHIRFYHKPGCRGNARQRQLLEDAGHQVECVDLLQYPWSTSSLHRFLGELPVTAWFNRSAPAIKSGQLNPAELEPEDALALLLQQPLLIRRPLLEVEGRTLVGFDPAKLAGLLRQTIPTDIEGCAHPHTPCRP